MDDCWQVLSVVLVEVHRQPHVVLLLHLLYNFDVGRPPENPFSGESMGLQVGNGPLEHERNEWAPALSSSSRGASVRPQTAGWAEGGVVA